MGAGNWKQYLKIILCTYVYNFQSFCKSNGGLSLSRRHIKIEMEFFSKWLFLVLTYEINNGCIRVPQVPAWVGCHTHKNTLDNWFLTYLCLWAFKWSIVVYKSECFTVWFLLLKGQLGNHPLWFKILNNHY